MKIIGLLACAAALVSFTPCAHADSGRLVGSAGIFNIFQSNEHQAADIRADFRWDNSLLWKIKPFAAVEATTDWTVFALGGLYADFGIAPHWYITPSFGGGLYLQGSGKDLGNPIEFRTQVEASYEFDNQHRIGVGISHYSNADIGDRNPGAEAVSLSYSIPFSF